MLLPPSRCRPLRRLLLPLLALSTAGCQVGPVPPERVHLRTVMVTITDTELLPEPLVVVPTSATVVWRNAGALPMSIEVGGAVCNDCDTVLGFAPAEQGARATTVAPGDVATLCFHDAGTFPFVAHLGSTEHRGVIQVGEKR